MKTFQKLLTNSLLFAENRLCRKEGAERPGEGKIEATKKSADGKFTEGQVVEGFGLKKEDNVTVEKIEGDKVYLSGDNGLIAKDKELGFQPVEGKKEKYENVWLRQKGNEMFSEEEKINPLEFVPAERDEVEKAEVMEKCKALVSEKRKELEQKLDKIIEETADETGKEGAKKNKEESLENFDEKTKTLLEETEKNLEIKGLDADKTIQATAAAILEQFPELAEEKSKEVADDFGAKAAIEGSQINNPEKLFKWLEDQKNKEYMRSLAFPDWNGGAGKATVNFKNVQDKLGLKQESYKVVVKYLRIGNLFEDADIKKIISVKLKGRKALNAKYFSKGYDEKVGAHVKGLYAEKFKYLAILEGTEIEFGSEENKNLSEMQKQEMAGFGLKVEKAKGEGAGAVSADTEPAPGTPEAKAEAEAEKTKGAAATSPESRTAQGLDAIPVKPLEPTESKDVAGAKEFNGITYKPNGANFDIIDTSTEKVTNTVDKKTLRVLAGQEIPDEGWMKETIKKAFPYFKVEPEVSWRDGGYINVLFKDDKGNQIDTDYDLKTGKIIPLSTSHDRKGDVSQLLKDTAPETVVQFRRDLGDSVNPTAELNDKFANNLSKEKWMEALSLMADQPSPSKSILAFVIGVIAIDDFKKVDNSKITTLRQKISAENIVKEWITNKDFVSKESVEVLEIYSGGKLEEGTINEIAKYEFDEGGKEEAIRYLFDTYGKSNAKIAETYMKYANLRIYNVETQEDLDDTDAMESVLLALNGYAGQSFDEEMTNNIHDSYKQLDSLTAEDLGIESGKAEDLDATKKSLDAKCKDIFTKYLEANAGKKGARNYAKIFETRYNEGFEFKGDDLPSANVFARYLKNTDQTILTAGALDGTKSLTPVPGNDKYIKAFLEITEADPNLSLETDYNYDLLKGIHKVASELKTPMAAIWESECAWYMKSKKVEGIEEKSKDQAVLKLYELAKSPSISAKEKIKILKEIDSYSEGTEGAYTYVYLTKVLGLTNKNEYQTWYNKEFAKACFESGQFGELDATNLEDPNQKEFIEAWKTPTNLVSRAQVGRLTRAIGAENMKKLVDEKKDKLFTFTTAEIYLAIGLPGEAKKIVDTMRDKEDEGIKKYYLARLSSDKDEKRRLLVEAANAPEVYGDVQIEIFEELKKEGILPDMLDQLDVLAGKPLITGESLTEIQKTQNRAILRARLMRAKMENFECLQKNDLESLMPEEKKSMTFDATKMPAGVAEGEAKCEPGELITEMSKYFEGVKEQGGEIKEEDKALLKDMHSIFQKETVPDNQKADYAKLMAILGDAKYMEGIDISSLEPADQAKILESRGEFLEAAKALTDTTKPEDLSKKKDLLAKALNQAGEDTDKKTGIAAEYATLDEQGSQEKAVDIYLGAGKYEEAANLMKASNKITKDFIKSKIDDLADPKADQASKAEEICLTKGFYDELIKVYEGKKEMDVKLGLLFSAALNNKISYDKIFDLLMFEDGRTKDKFTGASDEQKKVFLRAVKDKLTTDTIKDKIRSKLGIDQTIEDFLKDTESQPAAEEQPTVTTKFDVDTVAIEGKKLTFKEKSGNQREYILDLRDGTEAKAERWDEERSFVDFYSDKTFGKRVGVFIIFANEEPILELHEEKEYSIELTGNTIMVKKIAAKPAAQEPPAAQPAEPPPQTPPKESGTPPPTE